MSNIIWNEWWDAEPSSLQIAVRRSESDGRAFCTFLSQEYPWLDEGDIESVIGFLEQALTVMRRVNAQSDM